MNELGHLSEMWRKVEQNRLAYPSKEIGMLATATEECLESIWRIFNAVYPKDTFNEVEHPVFVLCLEGLHLGQSILDLLRSGYIFGAYTLCRPLAERALYSIFLAQNESWALRWFQTQDRPDIKKVSAWFFENDPVSLSRTKEIQSLLSKFVHSTPELWWPVETADGGERWVFGPVDPDDSEIRDAAFLGWSMMLTISSALKIRFADTF